VKYGLFYWETRVLGKSGGTPLNGVSHHWCRWPLSQSRMFPSRSGLQLTRMWCTPGLSSFCHVTRPVWGVMNDFNNQTVQLMLRLLPCNGY
jgi:hypothetical protein